MVARMMKKSFSVAKTWKDYPNGCYIFSDNRVYFNHHLTGQSNELACPICYRPGSSGSHVLLKNILLLIELKIYTLLILALLIFFVAVFVEIPWKVLVRPNDDSVKVISPLLHIATKLSSEPQVRKVRMKTFTYNVKC